MKRINKSSLPHYNIEEEPLTLSKPLMDLLLYQNRYTDLLALYTFYYYTAKWQGTNQPYATTAYVAHGIGWGVDKVITIKKMLVELKLIENVIRKDGNGRILGHFIKLNLLSTTPGNLPPLVRPQRKFFKEENSLKEKNLIPPPIELVRKYCQERNSSVNPQTFWDWNTSKGWKVGNTRMKDWQAAVRTWEQRDKQEDNKNKPKFVIDDGIRYKLCPDGRYRNASGELYIE